MHRKFYIVRHRWHHHTDHHAHQHHHAHPGEGHPGHHRGHHHAEPQEGHRCSPFDRTGRRGHFFGGRGGPGPRPGGKARAGNVRAAILALLSEAPFNGYQIIQEIAQRSNNVWKPSSGSVYPALQQLIDEGLVQETQQEGKRLFELTAAGQTHCQEHGEELREPWKEATEGVTDAMFEFRGSLQQLMTAAAQVAQVGNPEQVAEANRLLVKTRKALYRLLAEDDSE